MTSTSDNVSRTRDFIRLVRQEGRLDLIDEFLHPRFHNNSVEGELSADKEGVRTTMAALHAAFADMTTTILHCFEHDGVVATNKFFRGRHVGEWLGQPPTGEMVELHVLDFLRFDDGLIVEHWSALRPLRRIPE